MGVLTASGTVDVGCCVLVGEIEELEAEAAVVPEAAVAVEVAPVVTGTGGALLVEKQLMLKSMSFVLAALGRGTESTTGLYLPCQTLAQSVAKELQPRVKRLSGITNI